MSKPAGAWLKNYEDGIAGSETKYVEGVQNPRRDWAAELQAAKTKMVTNYQKSMSDGRFDRGVQQTGTQGWAAKTVAKSSNYSASAERARTGYSQKVNQMKAIIDNVQQRVNAMPRATQEQRIARAVAMMRGVSEEHQQARGT